MKQKTVFGLFLLYFCLVASPAFGQNDTVIVFDRSYSMKGFFDTGAAERLVNKLKKTTDADLLYFQSENDTDVELNPESKGVYGQTTLIGTAVAQTIKDYPQYTHILLVTDNVQDAGRDSEQDSIERFYDLLRSDAVQGLWLFPQRSEFRGVLYAQDGVRRLTNKYDGQRAIMVYFLSLEANSSVFKQAASKYNDERQGDGILVKPSIIPKAVAHLVDPEGIDNLILESNDGSVITFRSKKRSYKEREPMSGSFRFKLKVDLSGDQKLFQFRNWVIDKSSISADITRDDPPSDFYPLAKTTAKFRPPEIESVAPREESAYIEAKISTPEGARLDISNFWQVLSRQQKYGDYVATVPIKLEVAQVNLKLNQSFSTEWSTKESLYFNERDPVKQRQHQVGVPHLDELFIKLQPAEVESIRSGPIIKVRYTLEYPDAFWYWVGALLTFIAASVGAYFVFVYSPPYQLTSESAGSFFLGQRARGRTTGDSATNQMRRHLGSSGYRSSTPQKVESLKLPLINFIFSKPHAHQPFRFKRALRGVLVVASNKEYLINEQAKAKIILPGRFYVKEKKGA